MVMKDDLGISTPNFAMDPSQDLMVLFKERMLHRTSFPFIFRGAEGDDTLNDHDDADD